MLKLKKIWRWDASTANDGFCFFLEGLQHPMAALWGLETLEGKTL